MIYVAHVTRLIYCLEISVRARYILLKHFSLSILKRKSTKKKENVALGFKMAKGMFQKIAQA